jgi:hypothetical protein
VRVFYFLIYQTIRRKQYVTPHFLVAGLHFRLTFYWIILKLASEIYSFANDIRCRQISNNTNYRIIISVN